MTLADVKDYLRVDLDTEDAAIQGIITRARRWAEDFTRRAFITQTWKMQADFGPYMFELARAPLQSVTSIIVTGFDGSTTTVDPVNYVVDTINAPGRVSLNAGQIWPTWPTMRGFTSFLVTYVAGYGADGTTVPPGILNGLMDLISFYYVNREGQDIPQRIKDTLWEYRIIGELRQEYRRNPAIYQGWF